jgi:hypothetical protein
MVPKEKCRCDKEKCLTTSVEKKEQREREHSADKIQQHFLYKILELMMFIDDI